MDDAFAKGINFVFAKEYILQKYPEPIWDKALNNIPEEYVLVWKNASMNGCYSFNAFKAMVNAISTLVNIKSKEEYSKLYEYIADKSLNTIYKIFFKLTQPAFVISKYPILWNRFFIIGEIKITFTEKGAANLNFILPEIFNDWIEAACYGYSKKAIDLSGGRNMLQQMISQKKIDEDKWESVFKIMWNE